MIAVSEAGRSVLRNPFDSMACLSKKNLAFKGGQEGGATMKLSNVDHAKASAASDPGSQIRGHAARWVRQFKVGVVMMLILGLGWSGTQAWAQTHNYKSDKGIKISEFDGMKLYMDLKTVGRFQSLDHEGVFVGGKETLGLPSGFQTAWGNLGFLADYDGKVEVFFELYLSSRPHPEKVYGHEGYLLIRGIPENLTTGPVASLFNAVDFKAGHFEIDYGDHRYRRSDNARVQKNPLIGNYIIDPKTVEIGVEVATEPNRFNLLMGVGSGGTTEKFKKGTGLSFHGKLWGDITKSLRASGSFYRVDHSGNKVQFTGSWSNLFSGHRSGGPYSGVLAGGNAPGQVMPGAGQKVTATQFDVTWGVGSLELYSHYGWMRDADINGSDSGSPEESWAYYAAESTYRITSNLHAAIRYSGADANKLNGISSKGRIERIQIGGGFWLTENMLAKVEYVHQRCNNFTDSDGKVGGVDIWMDPVFSGAISEVSFAF